MKRRTTREIDAEAQRIMLEWEAAERAVGRDPDRPGWLAELMDNDPNWRKSAVVKAWWRLHAAAQRYG